MGVNRFECRACPYEWTVDRKWYDQTVMKEKEVEQVFGGKDEWANADSVESELTPRRWREMVVCVSFPEANSRSQHNARPRVAIAIARTSTSCRSAVPTNR